jgi:uncharacterized protein (TIGR03435 family)
MMNPFNKDDSDIVDSHLGLFGSPPEEQISQAEERALRRLRSEPGHDAAPTPALHRLHGARTQGSTVHPNWAIAFASAAALVLFVTLASWSPIRTMLTKTDTAAVVEVADGGLYDSSGAHARAGEAIAVGAGVRTNGGKGAVLALADGSRVEIRSKSELSFERAVDGLRIRLHAGGIIVNAAKQRTGHLYVQTKDMTVSVVGTVFVVNADSAGSRVAVIEGEVHVQQGATETTLRPGDHVATSPALDLPPVRESIAWSRNASALLALLQQSAVVPPAITPQSPQSPAAARETFEVASIRLRAAAAPGGRGGPGPDGQEPKCYGSVQLDPRRLALTNMMLFRIIALAYGKSCYELERLDSLTGGPRWVTADRYDIEATLPQGGPSYTREQFDPATWGKPETSDAFRLHAMLQTMLAERFKLVVRRETREVPGFALSVVKGGPKLTAWKEGELVTLGAVTGGPNSNGEWRSIVRGNKLSVGSLSNQLRTVTGRPVVDRTGITGDFNYSIEFTPFSAPPDAVLQGRPIVAGPTLFTALEETLGLHLEPARVPIEFLVIERVERPTEN